MTELTFEQRIALRMLSRALHMTDSSGAWELVLANTDALSSQTLAFMTDAVADTLDPPTFPTLAELDEVLDARPKEDVEWVNQARKRAAEIHDIEADDPDDFLHPECSVCRGRHPNDGRHSCE